MKRTLNHLLLLFVFLTPFCMGAENNTQTLRDSVNQALYSLEGWDNILIKEQLVLRMEDNQVLIDFLNQHKLGKTDKDIDESFQNYVNSLMEDQQSLAYITSQLIAISDKENINLDGALFKKPTFHSRLKKELDENLAKKSTDILLFRMLYFSLMEKYAIR